MPQTFNKNPITKISYIIMFFERTDKLVWLKHYNIFIFCFSKGLLHSIINDDNLPCKIICYVRNLLTELTEEVVAVCSDIIGYFGFQKGL